MENNPQQIINNFKESKKNFLDAVFYNKKYLLFFVGGVMIVLIIIIAVANGTTAKPTPQQQIPPTIEVQNTQAPVPQLSESEKKELEAQMAPQIENSVQGNYEVTKTKSYEDGWTLVQIVVPQTDPANVIMRKVNGTWKVIEGPGTYFDSEPMQQDGAPTDLQQDANTNNY